jgi:DNA-binding CsgD family transcriptional regulator/pimeloyl-ACP methyl ester carboxylesterase
MQQQIHYARPSDGVHIAYAMTGSGSPLVCMPVLPYSHLDMELELPLRGAWFEDMAKQYTILRYDGRGSGLSDRITEDMTLEAHLEDLKAVTERAGIGRFALMARHMASPVAIAFAARYPERVSRLVLWHAFAKSSDFTDVKRTQALLSLMNKDWELYTETSSYANTAWAEVENAHQYAAYTRASITPQTYTRALEDFKDVDYSDCLPLISCPTLIFHRREVTKFGSNVSKALSAAIPDSRLVMPEGSSWSFFAEDLPNVSATLKAFLAEEAASPAWPPPIVTAGTNQSRLTEREREILSLLAGGRQNKEIAASLSVSVHTVDRHIANIYNKIGAHNRVEATAFALKHGIA